jgi:small subunit ribosomal protein S18
MENKYKNSKNKGAQSSGRGVLGKNGSKQPRSRVLSLAQLLSRVRKQRGSVVQTGMQTQNSSNPGSYDGKQQNLQSRNAQLGTKGAGSFGNAMSTTTGRSENKFTSRFSSSRNTGRSVGEQGFNTQRVRENIWQAGNMTKAQIRLESQKEDQKRQKPIKPIIPPKSLVIILTDRPHKIIYNRRIIDYKHCGLLQRYIGLGGKILPRRQTRLTAKQQRYIAKTIKSARIMGLLPFVSKEKGFFR